MPPAPSANRIGEKLPVELLWKVLLQTCTFTGSGSIPRCSTTILVCGNNCCANNYQNPGNSCRSIRRDRRPRPRAAPESLLVARAYGCDLRELHVRAVRAVH